ncbi:hypothetical protein [Nocardia amamiensis]|nr:hypothetical protein [Nocardia amamiensis]
MDASDSLGGSFSTLHRCPGALERQLAEGRTSLPQLERLLGDVVACD